MCSIFFFSFEKRAVYETMSKNVVEPEGPKWRHELHAG
jgi:hypothetical protein